MRTHQSTKTTITITIPRIIMTYTFSKASLRASKTSLILVHSPLSLLVVLATYKLDYHGKNVLSSLSVRILLSASFL